MSLVKRAVANALRESDLEKAISRDVAMAASQSAQAQAASGATYPINRVTNNPSSPFRQTGGFGGAYAPLPRGDETFNSLFGPGYPLIPDPLDPVGPNGRIMPRRSQYLVAWNLQLQDRQVPWTMLQWLAEQCDVVNRCIDLVQSGMAGREWSWGFSDAIIEQIMVEDGESNHARAMAIAKDKYGPELDRVKMFFETPDIRMGQTFNNWLMEMCWDALVYDGIAVYPQYTLGGDLMALSLIDPSTIKVLRDNQGYKPQPPAPAFQQILYGFPRGEFQATNEDGEVDAEYQGDQLSYYVRRQRPETVYGYPQVEEVMTIATTYLARQAWMAAEYSYGAMPKTFFKLGENSTWSPEQTFWYEQQFNDRLSGQINRRQQAFLLPNGMEPMFSPQIEEHYKNDYDSFLITQIGSRFGVPATLLGVQAKAGLSGGKQMEGEEDQTQHFVFNALIDYFIGIMNDLARRYLKVGPEITATCQDSGGSKEDVLQQANADKTIVGFGGMTLNDYKASKGEPLYDMPEADEPMIITATGPVFLKGTLAVQDANTENTLNPPPPPTQVMVGPDGQPLPGQGSADGGSTGSDTNDNSGRAPVPSGDGKSAPSATGSSGSSGASGSSDDTKSATKPPGNSNNKSSNNQSNKIDSDGNSTASEAPAGTKPTDQSDTSKELAAFAKFAKQRIDRGTWRDFEFTTVQPLRAAQLNELGRVGRFDVIKASVAVPHAAGIVVKALDSGRVLMVQRGIDNHNELAAGKWEFPGGCLDEGEVDPFAAAKREWEEEVGVELPKGTIAGSWTTPDGIYTCFVYTIKKESKIDLSNARSSLDGTGDDEIENVAWWTPKDLVANPAIRVEIQSSDWALIGHAKSLDNIDAREVLFDLLIKESLTNQESLHYNAGWRPWRLLNAREIA